MLNALKTRISEIESEIRRASSLADSSARGELLEDLERHVEELEARGGMVPRSALVLLRPGDDDTAEDLFDNMPV
ncbi:hypothetical protein Q4543_22155 [Salipiger sp. 1_MG-2023]|uniref:hypothetical protein n=1 Tax=Salipiger sp. 1_MG-2023 TaxID=3062665 RepID=UPI0026E23CE2|nr:hypothetical protein [Salipiger sp. 1_MG-2023]MDO6588205.1 hypothetical protein [Salipiger sp. 1_MG-2023]